MCTQRHWFCDGTFDSAPEGYQLYTIHVVVNPSRTIPLVYAVARNKNRNTYYWTFGYLKGRQTNLDPLSVTVDFEQASITSIRSNFPSARIQGCLFHFAQCLWRKIQNLGLQQWYQEDTDNAFLVKRFHSLAFVPSNKTASRGFSRVFWDDLDRNQPKRTSAPASLRYRPLERTRSCSGWFTPY